MDMIPANRPVIRFIIGYKDTEVQFFEGRQPGRPRPSPVQVSFTMMTAALSSNTLLNLAELYHGWGGEEKVRALCPRLLVLEVLVPEHLRTSETLSHCKTAHVKR